MAISTGRGFDYGVFHIKPEVNAQLLETISAELRLGTEKILELLDFGAVYLNQNRVFNDTSVSSTDLIRIHTTPRRFPIQLIDWQKLILFENSEFLILNKPQGIPCHPSVDNFQENILQQIKNVLNKQVYITNRLDVPTGGLLVLAKTKQFQSDFNVLLQEKKVKKLYQAAVEGRFPLNGTLVHYMENSPKAPKKVSPIQIPDGVYCELKILQNNYFDETNESQLSIDLITGRTHQIRAQLAETGFPIIGDIQYGGKSGSQNKIKLFCNQISFVKFDFILPGTF